MPPTHPPSRASSPRFCSRFCVGLTGGIASGKTLASERLAALGAAVVDTDVIAHQLTSAGGAAMPAIAAAFGAALLNTDGSMNRAAMRQRVFDTPSERARLEAIVHPLIHAQTRSLGESAVGSYVVFVVPLLAESARWPQQVDRIAVVDCAPAMQLSRLLARSGLPAAQAQQIIAAQASRAQRLALADDVIHNQGLATDLLTQMDSYHAQYLHYASAHEHGSSAKLAR